MTNRLAKAAFQATRLTSSTFLIKEYNDIYSEHPHIYAKLVSSANTMLIIDTGCGGASNDPDITIKSLKEFIETVKVEDNNGLPLNEGGSMKYIVALTHCHYDHIRTLNVHHHPWHL
jgi:glyoxylase-like metal-dependent hydrolase (beta-lactamase superfamily II)